MRQGSRLTALFVALAVLAPVGLSDGATGAAHRVARAQAAPPGNAKAGAAVFTRAGCGGCHVLAAAGAKGTVGPDLDRSKPPYDRVVTLVTSGRGAMPSFKGRLSTTEIADVAAFVAESVGATAPGGTKLRPGGRAKPPAAVVRVVLGEWLLIASPQILRPGRTAFVVRNTGNLPHALVVMRADPSPGRLGGFELLRPGHSRRLTLSLRAGVYLLFSNRQPDLRKGMIATLSVRAKGAASATPAPGSGAQTGSPPAAGGAAPGGAAAAGAQLFAQAGCGSCHTFAAAGATGTLGPNLDQLKLSAAQVASVVKSGRGAMPSFAGRLTDAQIAELAAYVAGGGGAPGSAPGGTSPRPQDGPGLVRSFCGACHTLQAAGTSGTAGPNLDRGRPSREEVVEVVTSGAEGMPSFATSLSAREIQLIAEFVAASTSGGHRHNGSWNGGSWYSGGWYGGD